MSSCLWFAIYSRHRVFNKKVICRYTMIMLSLPCSFAHYFSLCSYASQVSHLYLIRLLYFKSCLMTASIAFYMHYHHLFYALYFMYIYFLPCRCLWFNLCTDFFYLSLINHVFHLWTMLIFSSQHIWCLLFTLPCIVCINILSIIKTHDMNKRMLLLHFTCSSTWGTVIFILFTSTKNIMFGVFIISTTAYTCIIFY